MPKNATIAITEAQFDDLVEMAYLAVCPCQPGLSRDAFTDLPIKAIELMLAIPVIAIVALVKSIGAGKQLRRAERTRRRVGCELHPPKDQIARRTAFAFGLCFVARAGETVPRQPPVGDQAAGEPQLRIGRQDHPGPAVHLLRCAHPSTVPAQPLFTNTTATLPVK